MWNMAPIPPIRVVAGVLSTHTKDLLIGRRCGVGREYVGCWEFPGGKVDGSETDAEALAREWQEELGLEVMVLAPEKPLWTSGIVETPNGVQFCLTAYQIKRNNLHAPYWLRGSHSEVRWLSAGQVMYLPPAECTPSLFPIARSLLPARDWTENLNVIY